MIYPWVFDPILRQPNTTFYDELDEQRNKESGLAFWKITAGTTSVFSEYQSLQPPHVL